ncbi:MAG TPA: oxidoreductase, partial [Thermoanaerobaculia bacterium]|nr:oxidoreductase [Thermoanaerobaculia bacterium]
MTTFPACRGFATGTPGGVECRLVEMETDALSPGEVVIAGEWSGINFKDALAVTGRGRIFRTLPCNAGIDVAGRVAASS